MKLNRKKRNSFRPATWSARNPDFIRLTNILVGLVGKSNFAGLHSSFFGSCQNIFFGQRWLSPPRKKLVRIDRMPMWSYGPIIGYVQPIAATLRLRYLALHFYAALRNAGNRQLVRRRRVVVALAEHCSSCSHWQQTAK